MGLLLDESGALNPSKLIWSPTAWTQLLGRSAEDLAKAAENVVLIKYLEHRLLFLKIALLFGWSGDVGRLCVLGVTII